MRQFSVSLPWLLLASLACGQQAVAPEKPDNAAVRVLFVGNSLTYTHDIPSLVQEIAELDGRTVLITNIVAPNYSLEDHWHAGLAQELRRVAPDLVVMQQGPSSLPDSRLHLIEWASRISSVAREVGAEPALYMVWPDRSRLHAFPAVESSYAAAAEAADARLLPAGTTWLNAWQQDSRLPLYAPDGLHASELGALAAAYTIYAGLFDLEATGLKRLSYSGNAGELEIVIDAAAASLRQWQP